MKAKRIVTFLILGWLLLCPFNVWAKSCSDYNANNCPHACKVENGACVETYVGDTFCEDENILEAVRIFGYLVFLMRIFVPIIIILVGTIDFVKIVMAGTEDSFKKQGMNLLFRFLIGVFIFFIPTLIDAVMQGLYTSEAISSEYKACERCLFKPFDC